MAESKAPRRLDEALRPGGLYYTVDGTAHDAHGNVLEGAPKRPENTKPEDQPGARMAALAGVGPGGGAAGGLDMRMLGLAIAQGLRLGTEGGGEGEMLPSEANMQAIKDSQTQRDELAGTAADAKVKPNTPTVDARVIPSMIPGGEAAAAAANSPATSATPTGGTAPSGAASDTGSESGSSSSSTDR